MSSGKLWALLTLGWRLELLNLWGLVRGLVLGAREVQPVAGASQDGTQRCAWTSLQVCWGFLGWAWRP